MFNSLIKELTNKYVKTPAKHIRVEERNCYFVLIGHAHIHKFSNNFSIFLDCYIYFSKKG